MSTFEKVHTVVAGRTLPSQIVQKNNVRSSFGGSDVDCRKSERRFGAKHISKSKFKNTKVSDLFWRFNCRFASFKKPTLHYMTRHYTARRAVAARTCSADRQMDREIDILKDRETGREIDR